MIRPYIIEDKEALLSILRCNIPLYFDESEEVDFIEYLDKQAENYFIIEQGTKLIGGGGINYFPETMLARISWDIIHPDFQGKGMGKKLTLFRINQIKENPTIRLIKVRTSQLAYKFYVKLGFELERIEKDFWAKGFDLYQMKIEL